MSLVRVAGATKAASRGATKVYELGGHQLLAFDGITLAIEQGDYLVIAGSSDSGKTTLLNIIGCIDVPSQGEVYIDEQPVSGRTPDELADLRARSIGFIFQTFNLIPVLTAAGNVEYPLLLWPEISRSERRARVRKYLAIVGLERYAYRTSFPAGRGSGWPSPALWRSNRASFWPKSRPPTWITRPVRGSWI